MAIDLAAIGILALAAVSGSFNGALHQLVRLAGMVVGWQAAWHLGPVVAIGLGRWLPNSAARGAAGLLLFVGFSVLASWVGHRFLATKRLSGAVRSAPDRGLGALLGGAKAGLVVWIALSALALAGGRVALGRYAVDGAESDLAALAHRYNLLARLQPATDRALERFVPPPQPGPSLAPVPGGGSHAR
jgi:membrane protein required for colicin V production